MKHFQDTEDVFSPKTGGRPNGRRLVPLYRVGERLRKGRHSWPDGAQFAYSPAGHELTLFRTDIDAEVTNEIGRGEAEFALVVELPVLVLAYRFGRLIPWNDTPYCWHLQPVNWRRIPSVSRSTEARALLWITLVGAQDGIIYAQRGVTLSPPFTRAMHTAMRVQAMSAFDPEECTSAISTIFLKYPRTVDRLALAVAQTRGNE